MSVDGQGTKWRRNTAENFNRLSMAYERYRRQTDWRIYDDITHDNSLITARAVQIEHFTARVLYRASYRVLEYWTRK